MKKPLDQQQIDVLLEKHEALVGEHNGIIATTWQYCWRCGKVLNVNNRNEVTNGVHTRCSTDAALAGTYDRIFTDKSTLQLVSVQLNIGGAG